jgi:hypothetical protein
MNSNLGRMLDCLTEEFCVLSGREHRHAERNTEMERRTCHCNRHCTLLISTK